MSLSKQHQHQKEIAEEKQKAEPKAETKVLEVLNIQKIGEALRKIKPFGKKELIGSLSISLNEHKQNQLQNMMTLKMLKQSLKINQDDKEKLKNANLGLHRVNQWIKEEDEKIKFYNELIADIKRGRIVI